MLNKVVLQGRAVADPDIRTIPNGSKVASLRIAVDRNYRTKDSASSDFFNVTVWRTTAEFVERYVKKGQLIIVEGSLQNKEWVGSDGKKRTAVDVVADNIYFCESKKAAAETHDAAKKEYAPKAPATKDQDLPF